MGALKVEAFACSIRSDEDADFLILLEAFFHFAALVAQHSAIDDHHGVVIAEQGAYPVREVTERVAVFGKNDQLFAEPLCVEHAFFVLQQAGKLFPFAVSAAGADGVGLGFQRFERGNFRFQLRDGSRGTGLVSYAFFGVFQLGGSQVVIVEFVRKVQITQFVPVAGTLAEPLFTETVFQSFAAAVQRLIDGLGRRRETPLEHGEREAHGGAAFVVQIVGAIEFVLNVGGHSLVEFGFFGGKAVVHRDGVALREQGRTVELEQFFFDKAAHDIGDVDSLRAGTGHAAEAILIHQREEELKIFFLAVVRGCRKQKHMSRDAGKQAAKLEAARHFDFAAPDRG